jgi:hypothetical protein
MTAAVKELLKEIDALPHKAREELDRALAKRLEMEWEAEATKARRIARKRKIGMAEIQAAINQRRYGE